MNFGVFLCVIGVILVGANGKIRKKRDIWYTYVDDYPIPPENTYSNPQVFTPYTIPRYPVVHPWPVQQIHGSAPAQNMQTDQLVGNPLTACTEEQFKCSSPHQCIPKGRQCDGYVDCIDASDEQKCDCLSRLETTKKCDYIFDCPRGEDELGCFGCGAEEYSCYENEIEFNKQSKKPQCFTNLHRCDGRDVCTNSRDEVGCSILSQDVPPSLNEFLFRSVGILHHYLGFQAYPVCDDNIGMMQAACEFALGDNFGEPTYEYIPTSYNEKFISSGSRRLGSTSTVKLVDECRRDEFNSSNAVLQVNCVSKSRCGAKRVPMNNGTPRIAGGTEAIPGSNPCGTGNTISEK